MSVKIAIIGAGSLGFTRRLVYDVLCVPELRDCRIALHDINPHNLDMIDQVLVRDVRHSNLPAVITADLDRKTALTDADYVICCARIGGLEAFTDDIEIPLKYGVDQCVGDTLCVGGLMYAQRSIAAMLEFCRDIRAVSKPGALLLNYANPNAMNTWACNLFGKVPTVGLCHGVPQGAKLIARALGVPDEQIEYVCIGINHQTWYTEIWNNGRPVSGEELLRAMESHPEISQQEKVRIDMLRRFGYFTTESNGHVSEYVPWYRKRPAETAEWISMDSWINGETAGYLRVCTENRNWFEHEFPEIMSNPPKEIGSDRSLEHGSYIIEALETGRIYRGHFNVVNRGNIVNLPEGCIVEIPGYVDRTGINSPAGYRLPLACAATCAASVRVQEMGMLAAVHGDPLLLKQAMLHDPLTGAVLNPPEIWQLADEMIVAQAQYLPQYAHYVEEAKRNLAEHYITPRALPVDSGHRAAVKSVEEIARLRREEERRRANDEKLQYDPDREVSKGNRG